MESSVGGWGGGQLMPIIVNWAINAPPPLKSSRMKLQRHVRGQNRGSWVCLVHLDYFQLADIYSCGFKLKISILSSSTHPQLTHQHHPPTHNSLKLVEGWFLLSFSSQTKQKLFSISNFQFSKFQNS